ncbi:MAG: hypothetical protein RIS47_606 [Bacteroidota bacterium]|jgi:biopolymer transport protein ExbD
MSKFKNSNNKEVPAISTASLPDIVFMLLFFFMVSTVMRETELKISNHLPKATQIKKLEKKSLVANIYVGKPTSSFQSVYGTEPRIQLNDRFSEIEDISTFVESERESRNEVDRLMITWALKVDKDTKMGIVTDLKQELRKNSALKLNYSTLKNVEKQ